MHLMSKSLSPGAARMNPHCAPVLRRSNDFNDLCTARPNLFPPIFSVIGLTVFVDGFRHSSGHWTSSHNTPAGAAAGFVHGSGVPNGTPVRKDCAAKYDTDAGGSQRWQGCQLRARNQQKWSSYQLVRERRRETASCASSQDNGGNHDCGAG